MNDGNQKQCKQEPDRFITGPRNQESVQSMWREFRTINK